MAQLRLTVPPGVQPGQTMQFQTPEGEVMSVQVPPGVPPGGSFVFTVPDASSVPMGIRPSATSQSGSVPMGAPLTAAQKFAECPICFEPLHAAPVGFFLDSSGSRVSAHYYNLAAAQQWLGSGNGACPLTRKAIAQVKEVPDVRSNPDAWFSAVDIDGNNKLTRCSKSRD